MATNPLRILLAVDSEYPSMGGSEMQARLLARVLAAAGHRVEIVAPRHDPALAESELFEGVQVTRIVYPQVRLLGTFFLCAKFALWLWRRRGDFDAIHVHIAKNLAAVAGLLRPFMRPTVTTKISGAYEFEGGILDPRRRGTLLFRLYNWCIRRGDSMQCISEFTRAMLAEAGYPDAKLRRIPNAVDLSRFPGRPAGAALAVRHFVFVGRVERVKALDVLVEAWARSGLGREARLTIGGDGSELAAIRNLAQARGVDSSIDFPGRVADVPALLASAQVYVQCSHVEGLSNSILEAMAMALPVVATRISGSVDVVTDGDNGLLVPPGDSEALAAALRRLFEDPPLAARMGERSRARAVSRFSVPAVLGLLERAYRGLPGPAPEASPP